jgi:hypothetical protein
LVGLSSTGWGGIALIAGALSASLITGIKWYRAKKGLAQLNAKEVSTVNKIATALEEISDEIERIEDELQQKEEKVEEFVEKRNKVVTQKYAVQAVRLANELDELYEGLRELNIANPLDLSLKPPKITNKYAICDEGLCDTAGKIRSDRIWGDIETCCRDAPMVSVTRELSGALEDINHHTEDISMLVQEMDNLKEVIKTELPLSPGSERAGGSLISKRKNKSKRQKTKRKKTKRKKTKRKKTKRNINK